MPVKRRLEKRRFDPHGEAEAWSGIFQCGFAMFDDEPETLAAFGVELDGYGRPDESVAEDAWRRLGETYLATRTPTPGRDPWALTQFGDPHAG